MTVSLRSCTAADAPVLGDICYRAFETIAQAHNFTPDFPSAEHAVGMIGGLIGNPGFFGVAAEVDGKLVGSNFMDERSAISGIGPITVDPAVQDDGAGRAMMQAAIERCRERGVPGVRLVQAGYHRRSLALYLKLGFEAREHLSCLQGPAIGKPQPGCTVRAAKAADLAACNALCFRVHGHDRGGDLAAAIAQGGPQLVERAGRITGYTTGIAFFGHTVGETNDDLKALIGAATVFGGAGFLVPTGNGELVRWCMAEGLRITQTLTLMSMGLYNQPQGDWLPSILF